MSSSVWPVYRGFAVRDLKLLAHFAADPARFRRLALVALLLAAYLAGLLVRIPGAHLEPASTGEHWWFLLFLDKALTGGALRRGGLFSLGVLGPLVLSSSRQAGSPLRPLLRKTIFLSLTSALVALNLRARGLVAPGMKPLLMVAAFVALGGICLKLIDTRLVRYHGPNILYTNLVIVLVGGLRTAFAGLGGQQRYWAMTMILGCVAFISISAYMLMHKRILVQVENIEHPSGRGLVLELPAMPEPLLDFLSVMFLTLYVSIAGLVSLSLGWHSITTDNIGILSVISIAVFGLCWAMFMLLSKHADLFEMLGQAGSLGLSDARSYALRMLNHFWVIPGCSAGRDTEEWIKLRLASVAKRSFLLFASWIAVSLVLEHVLARTIHSGVLFPFGGVVFIFLLVMVVGNASAIAHYVGATVNRFKQIVRGQSRVIAEMYPLGRTDYQERISIEDDFKKYWNEEKLSDQLQDMLQWVKLAKQIQLHPPRATPRSKTFTIILRVVTRVMTAAVLSFLIGLICLLLFPRMGRQDMGTVMIPAFMGFVIAPEAVLKVIGRAGLSAK